MPADGHYTDFKNIPQRRLRLCYNTRKTQGASMLIKKITYRALYLCAVLLALTAIVAEFSPKIEVFALAKLTLSALFIAILVLAARLRNSITQSGERRRRTVRATFWAIFAFYLFYLIWLLFFDGSYNRIASDTGFSTYITLKTNFVPFVTIRRYLSNISSDTYASSALFNLVGNLAAFMPLGFFCPLLIKILRNTWVFIPLLLVGIAGIEGLQLLLRVGSCDIDDLILNSLGALFIYFLMKLPIAQRFSKRLDS
ncbi:MAG: VanZ family protein [Clostridia bacterium]|nr:VanZ family protein [Clostridia bacterium]